MLAASAFAGHGGLVAVSDSASADRTRVCRVTEHGETGNERPRTRTMANLNLNLKAPPARRMYMHSCESAGLQAPGVTVDLPPLNLKLRSTAKRRSLGAWQWDPGRDLRPD